MKGFFYSENIYNALRELSPRDRSIMRDALDAYIFMGELPVFTGMKKALFIMLKSEIENQATTTETNETTAPKKQEPATEIHKTKTKSEIINEFKEEPDKDAVFIKLPRVSLKPEPKEERTPSLPPVMRGASPGVYSFASAYGITQGELFTPPILDLKPKEEMRAVEAKQIKLPPSLEKEQTEKIDERANQKRFTRPKLDEVKEYYNKLTKKNLNDCRIFAETFITFYDSKGWRVGSSPMKSWKAAIRTWLIKDGYYSLKSDADLYAEDLRRKQEAEGKQTGKQEELFNGGSIHSSYFPFLSEPPPICPIGQWQQDFEEVCRDATLKNVFNTMHYYNELKEQGKSKIPHMRDAAGNFTLKTYKSHWDTALIVARQLYPEKFKALQGSHPDDIALQYTLAYRLKVLTLGIHTTEQIERIKTLTRRAESDTG